MEHAAAREVNGVALPGCARMLVRHLVHDQRMRVREGTHIAQSGPDRPAKSQKKAMPHFPPLPVRCRQITANDLDAVADLLANGFKTRSRREWVRVLGILGRHPQPDGFPKYGYMLESGAKPVGVILLIAIVVREGNAQSVRCNLSSWYVEPQFRCHAALLSARVLRHAPATYLNMTAAPNTWPTIEVQGFSRYRQGVFVAMPALAKARPGCEVVRLRDAKQFEGKLPPDELALLAEHARYGCVVLCCTTPEGSYPFVFRRRRIKRLLPCSVLIYCRNLADFARCAGPIGRYLALRCAPLVLLHADEPIAGLPGRYFAGHLPFYAKGPDLPRSGNLTYTEAAMFSF
jgi:hypothetical protein